jgi:uncharacterized protein YigA (DUF484 family)
LQELLDATSKTSTEAAGLTVEEQQAAVDAIIIDDTTNDSISTFHHQVKTRQKKLAKKMMQVKAAAAQEEETMTKASSLTLEMLPTHFDTFADIFMRLMDKIDLEMPQASPVCKKTKCPCHN